MAIFVVLVLFLVKKAVFGHFAGVIASDCLYIFVCFNSHNDSSDLRLQFGVFRLL
ncbi:hypothetical protein K438DRAFT_1850548 [Mycena galopus ATCC 62051]|nr:hypothetical protein K438DRAFT_1850548 [Mycena galopus ATCC 62051]